MRAGNEVTVNRKAFITAVTRVPRGGLRVVNQYTPSTTVIFATPPSLFVETPWVCTEIDAEGCWLVPVAVPVRVVIKAARVLPRTPRVTLLWIGGRLYLDRLSIDAKVASGYATGGKVGASVPERQAKERSEVAVAVESLVETVLFDIEGA